MYDDAGLLVKSVTVHDPDFTRQDIDLALASRRDELRNRHGFPLEEAMSNEANPANAAGEFYFVGAGLETDWVEKAELDALDRFKAENPDENLNGKHMTVVKRYRSKPPA
ncbi:hypothetical protein [Herbiconiux solani]|uniref:hypothetical protein n=1 Tax=Herbiconiux solani TaxID=661329 RepID=UPI0008252322|nr:hypothetical protein [Herbiconiux solani]